MKLKSFLIFTVLTLVSFETMWPQSRFEKYVDTYYPLAIKQQEEFGIPASVTLAQGILESGAGESKLAKMGNNHFGIKCHSDWQGDTMLQDDDAPDECFRVYETVEESFRDHSLFLKKPRYNPLFELEVTDYAGWAMGLRKCGYATDPNYGVRLITIIERYGLDRFDTEAGRNAQQTVDFIRDNLANVHHIRKNRGLHYVVAFPGDTYASIAKEFKIPEKKLRFFNDAGKKELIKDWEEVYLEEKNDNINEDIDRVTIGEGESFHSISQRFGIKLSSLKSLNKNVKDRPGSTLRLK